MSRFPSSQLCLEVLDARDVPAVLLAPSGDAEPIAGWGMAQYQYAFEGSYNPAMTRDAKLTAETQEDASAIVFVGGWGASSYQYAFEGTYDAANGELLAAETEPSAAVCHGVSVLAYARVDGVSPAADDVIVDGKIITAENYYG